MKEPNPSDFNLSEEELDRLNRLDGNIKFATTISFIVVLCVLTGILFWRRFSWLDRDWLISILAFPFLLMLPLILGTLLGKVLHGIAKAGRP